MKRAPVMLTYKHLEEADACSQQYREFRRIFGREVVATVTSAVAHAEVFDWDWAAQSLLRGYHYTDYSTRVVAWSWEPWRGAVAGHTPPPEGYRAFNRHRARAFAEAFLAQGGVKRPERPMP